MFSKVVRLTEVHALAIKKVDYELQVAVNNLSFLVEKKGAEYIGSEDYNRRVEECAYRRFIDESVRTGVVQLITDCIPKTVEFSFDLRKVTLYSDEEIVVHDDYESAVLSNRHFMSFVDMISKFYPVEGAKLLQGNNRILSRTITFQVTDACNLACTYCYQINKGTRRMRFEDAKMYIDKLLSGEDGFSEYVNPKVSPGIIIEFIGGEPLLEIDLIDQIVDYFRLRVLELDHPWAEKYCISVCSNGVLYEDPRVQQFLQKNKDNISFSVTLDGNKELHDKCRVFHDGSGSYDLAEHATKDWMARGYYMGSKITISPENLSAVYDALVHIVGLGYTEINANCVYEAEWTDEQSGELYKLLERFADFLLSDEKYVDVECSLLQNHIGCPKAVTNLDNWCGGTGTMLAMDPDGDLYPCIRYMESSLGTEQEPMCIGNVRTGLARCEKHKSCVECLNKIDRRTQSTDECFYCPIAEGCSWCSAYNYQVHGIADKRVTKICPMHKGRILANVYYWNKFYQKYGIENHFDLWVPRAWARPIIGDEKYDELCKLVLENGGFVNEERVRVEDYVAEDND